MSAADAPLTDNEGESLTDHDREVLWQTLGQCFSVSPNSPEACALVDAMVEQIVSSHVAARLDALHAENQRLRDELYGVKDSLKVVGDLRARYRAERDALHAEKNEAIDNWKEAEAENQRLREQLERAENQQAINDAHDDGHSRWRQMKAERDAARAERDALRDACTCGAADK